VVSEVVARRGQVWRNVYGAHVVVYELGFQQGCAVLWVYLCDADGVRIASDPIPMPPAGFPGELWTLTKEAA
jgi:hypothetical protein